MLISVARLRQALSPHLRNVVMRDTLTMAAREQRDRDRAGLPEADPGLGPANELALTWLCRAQDQSPDRDGGVARHFSLLTGWGRSYPETTGYIIPTLLAQAENWPALSLEARARRMLDWLVGIQFPEGGFQGGVVGAQPKVPVTFNTGQILLGLAAGAEAFGAPYDAAMAKAADWLVATQDDDGCWRRHPTPFAKPGEKTYETHVAWGLLEAARVAENRRWREAALRQVDWALGHQHANGWEASCCLSDNDRPLAHTLGYALRGIVEAWRHSREPRYLEAARRLADGLLTALSPEGHLPGRLDRRWRPAVPWSCLTGQVQIAWCWLSLYQATDQRRYRDAGLAANRFVRRTLQSEGAPDVVGGVKGSFPVDGDYGTYEYLNWAAKFLIDANQLEMELD